MPAIPLNAIILQQFRGKCKANRPAPGQRIYLLKHGSCAEKESRGRAISPLVAPAGAKRLPLGGCFALTVDQRAMRSPQFAMVAPFGRSVAHWSSAPSLRATGATALRPLWTPSQRNSQFLFPNALAVPAGGAGPVGAFRLHRRFKGFPIALENPSDDDRYLVFRITQMSCRDRQITLQKTHPQRGEWAPLGNGQRRLIEEHGLARLGGFVDGLQHAGDHQRLLGAHHRIGVVGDGGIEALGLQM